MKKIYLLFFACAMLVTQAHAQPIFHTVWSIHSYSEDGYKYALAPDGFKQFVKSDFGYEDTYFLIGRSNPATDFPYILPGPVDTWGGTWSTAGWRTNQVNILFNMDSMCEHVDYDFGFWLADYAKKFLPLIKVSINDHDEYRQLTADGYDVTKQPHPRMNEPYVDSIALQSKAMLRDQPGMGIGITIDVKPGMLKRGGNRITITVLQGSWIKFGGLSLRSIFSGSKEPGQLFVEKVQPAAYELLADNKHYQPLLVSCRHISDTPTLRVLVDDHQIFTKLLEKGSYQFEAPMTAVTIQTRSHYKIIENDKVIEEGDITRAPQPLQTPADYVDTRMGTAHSRWMIAPGPWMPFSMVKMSPDNQSGGWQSGYDPIFESIGTFSHIHEWTVGGLGIFASNGPLKTTIGDEFKPGSGYRSAINKRTEDAPIGYYKAQLIDYDIKAEMTATTRCGLLRFTFPQDRDSARVLIDLHIPTEYAYDLKDISLKKISDHRIEGTSHQVAAVWGRSATQDYTIHFVIEFDQPIQSLGGWVNDTISMGDHFTAGNLKNAGLFVQFNAKAHPVVQVRSAISMISLANAADNLQKELTQPFGWNFDAVRKHQLDTWNELFNRVTITTTNRLEKTRFYNALYRSICGRNTWSDVNGEWKSTDGKIQSTGGKHVALGGDAFWNTFWNLNQLWNLVTPEWSSNWVQSQLAMYKANGWLAKGPACMNYIPVMVAEHEIPQMVSAWQMGIRDFDGNKVLEAAVKMQTTPGQKVFNGYAGNADLEEYLKHQYVPSDKGRFSNSMEYSFDDWTVGQLARSLGNNKKYRRFNKRGYWWKNVMDTAGYCHLKTSDGKWVSDFDPFKSGANKQYVEGNAWQLTFFVPQDVPALINSIGKDKFINRLQWGFQQSEPWRFNGMNDQYWDYPVVQGNQQSMHFAFLFNWAGKPWLTQQWSRSVMDRFYGYTTNDAYLGDEDQGQLSAWLVMATLGLFQTDGGCNTNPVYEIGSPLFEKTEIDLGNRYGRGQKFTIIANGASRINKYVQKATLNGQTLNTFHFPASELLKGGSLVLEMGPTPNEHWGIQP